MGLEWSSLHNSDSSLSWLMVFDMSWCSTGECFFRLWLTCTVYAVQLRLKWTTFTCGIRHSLVFKLGSGFLGLGDLISEAIAPWGLIMYDLICYVLLAKCPRKGTNKSFYHSNIIYQLVRWCHAIQRRSAQVPVNYLKTQQCPKVFKIFYRRWFLLSQKARRSNDSIACTCNRQCDFLVFWILFLLLLLLFLYALSEIMPG